MKTAILVTGAAGFIGSHLCEALLAEGYKVAGVDNFDNFYGREIKEENLKLLRSHPDFYLAEGDAGNEMVLDSIPFSIDVVVHLAARAGVLPSLKNPKSYIQTNIELTNNLLEWMLRRKVKKMVFASSSSVYGNNRKVPFTEEDPVEQPISPYAFTKRSCELMNYTYHFLYHLDIINLRFFTVYGERQRPDLAIRKFVGRVLNGEPVTVYGDGTTARDYTYYADSVQGLKAAIRYVWTNENVFQTVNLGNNHPVTVNELIATIGKVVGKEPVLVYEDMKPGDVNITCASIEKAKQLLNYTPRTTLEEGLTRFVEWYRKNQYQVENR